MYILSSIVYSANIRDKTIRQVIAYKRLKNNGKLFNRKPQIVVVVVYRRVVCERFQLEGSDWECFDVLDRQWLMEGGCPWRFNCIKNTEVDEVCNL